MERQAQIRAAGCLTRRRGSTPPADLRRMGCFDAHNVGRYSMIAGAAGDAVDARGLNGFGRGYHRRHGGRVAAASFGRRGRRHERAGGPEQKAAS
jgi:hypothetical protein